MIHGELTWEELEDETGFTDLYNEIDEMSSSEDYRDVLTRMGNEIVAILGWAVVQPGEPGGIVSASAAAMRDMTDALETRPELDRLRADYVDKLALAYDGVVGPMEVEEARRALVEALDA
jgi:hypothetical protein